MSTLWYIAFHVTNDREIKITNNMRTMKADFIFLLQAMLENPEVTPGNASENSEFYQKQIDWVHENL
jgi:hypothetical protein